MGPYCKYCNQRCFTHIPKDTPSYLLTLYSRYKDPVGIIATCKEGQAAEKKSIGTCYDEILRAIESTNSVRYIVED